MDYGCFPHGALLLAVLVAGALPLFRRWRGVPRWRSGAVNAALLALSLLAAFVAAEGYFTFFVDTTDNSMNLLTSKRWMKRHFPPQLAFRDRTPRDAGTAGAGGVSIAVVGDSITYGQGVERDEDLYPSILERGLRSRGIRADIFNISRPSWDTGDELAAFQDAAARGQRFDIVVLGYCLNDIAPLVSAAPEAQEAVSLLKTPPAVLVPLLRNSFVVSYLYNRYVTLASPGIKAQELAVAQAYRQPDILERHSRMLRLFVELSRAYGARLVVATFPYCVVPWERYPYRDIHGQLDAFWGKLGVPNVDLLPAFADHPVRDLQAGRMDTHPNELAHRLAGEALVELLVPLLTPAAANQAGDAAAAPRP